MASGVTSAQCVETDSLMGEVDLATNEPMRPMSIDMEGSAEQTDAAVVIVAAHEDHGALEWGAKVELEALGEAPPLGGGIPAGSSLGAIGRDVTCGDGHQGCHIGAAVALPDFALPQGIEAFDSILEARLARWGEHRDNPQCQTQPADTPDGVGELVRSLEDRVVVKLRVGGQPVAAPALDQGLQRGPCAGALHDPGLGQCAVHAGAGEHIDKGPSSDLQVFNEIEAVELGLSRGQIGQIPALGRCRPALPMHAIKRAVTRKHAVYRHARGNRLKRLLMLQGQADGVGPVLAQDAFVPQRTARAQDALLQPDRCAVRGSAGLAVSERHPVNAFTASACNPVGGRAEAYPEFRRYRAQALPRANRLNELAAALFDRTFLAMAHLFKCKNATASEAAVRGTEANLATRSPERELARGRNSGRPTGSLHFSRAMPFEHSVFN